MKAQAIPLGVVGKHGLISHKSIFCRVIVIAVISRQHVLIDGIGIFNVIKGFAIHLFTVIEQAIAYHNLTLVRNDRSV